MPLADEIRPLSLDEVVGQRHLLGKNMPLRRIIESGVIPNMVFYGPSGIGKTTVANIIARQAKLELRRLNGTSAGTADIRAVIETAGGLAGSGGVLLYLDEIQYLNKKQQQSLLEQIETGGVTLIASTTENPFFYVYGAILSRCTIFQFKPLVPDDLLPAIARGFRLAGEKRGENITFDDEELVQTTIATGCGGDVRKALNAVELCVLAAESNHVTAELARSLTQRSSMRYDRDGDAHYDIVSAFQKSIRGSDENAALHYLARLVAADDLPSICRRLMVIAAEDIGLAFPNAIAITKACIDAALQLGLPEGRIPLADAVILLCTAPKSNSGVTAIDAALADIEAGHVGDIPAHLKDAHYGGAAKLRPDAKYLYPHDYPGHYVRQQYLPDNLRGRIYYDFGENKLEQAAAEYRRKIIEKEES